MIKKILIIGIVLIVLVICGTILVNLIVCLSTNKQLVDTPNKDENYDTILVLGCGVWETGPSPLLEERLIKAIELYKKGAAKKIIMSGDHGTKEYDEVNVMKQYAIDKGVPSEDIFMDHAGFNTYDSIYRARDIFKVKKMIIVTQKYHLYRALYLANALGIESVGVDATKVRLGGQTSRDMREILARNKDFLTSIFKPKPTYLGEEIPITGNGDITNDK
jgi:vancomycin permeability regulator SanA